MSYSTQEVKTLRAINALINQWGSINDITAYKKLRADLSEELRTIVDDAVRYVDGWIFCGADFSSLEDRISALTTKDPNKLKVYTDGFDGHCLRSYYYWPEAYVGIADTPEAINGTKDTHAEYRQKGKAPTFA